ncbi:hypothetical protein ACTXQV_65460, partial [Klebsiella pneumoniae]
TNAGCLVIDLSGLFALEPDVPHVRSISAFLQPGNYFEASLSVSDTSLEGQEAGTNPTRNSISDIANSDYRPSAALKLQLAPQFSFGFLY